MVREIAGAKAVGGSVKNGVIETQNIEATLHYHEATKHYPHRYARALGYMDWDTQPNPFRSYEGADVVQLPLAENDPEAGYRELYKRAGHPARSLTLENLSLFLELALGISAWKSIPGARWALRMNPSSGNLHPTESYVVLWESAGCSPGVYHYSPFLHALECRAGLPEASAALLKAHFKTGGFLFALTSIFWREAWKYGERGFRYSNHDMGHAIASASFAANLLGWKVSHLSEVADEAIGRLLGFDRTAWIEHEEEYPEVLCYVRRCNDDDVPKGLPDKLIAGVSGISFQGVPNRLSGDHVDWEIIPATAEAVRKSSTAAGSAGYYEKPFIAKTESELTAAQIIRRRRSAVAFDAETSVCADTFFGMLAKTLPRRGCAPFDFELGPARVHLLLFVHRVTGLAPGLYMFVRDESDFGILKSSSKAEFLWKKACEGLPLYLLEEGLLMREAAALSCNQNIAGDGSFSLGMIAKFRPVIEQAPFLYRHLFWETGMIGQVLYLEAEAHGVRATGIGCFFDDPVHAIMGLEDNTFQSLYHFTVGGPVEDSRLQTWPAYFHLKEKMIDPNRVIRFDSP
ncbi:MAG: SagB/ThcOx family dehydrogenase [Candidatus Omnitrophota bacterium]|nr:SagB/ThcOx family dehydrogenase [Candidatus Omnitrophota bacterium]